MISGNQLNSQINNTSQSINRTLYNTSSHFSPKNSEKKEEKNIFIKNRYKDLIDIYLTN